MEQNKTDLSNKKIIILSNRPHTMVPFHSIFHDISSDNLIAIAPKEVYEQKDNINDLDKYSKIYMLDKYFDSCAVDLCMLRNGKDNQISGIVCLSEPDIIRGGRARDYFSIPGQSYYSALAFRDKILMKEILKEKGIKVPIYSKVDSIFDVIEFIEKNAYPVVVKPVRGAGSFRTVKLTSSDDLNKLSEKGFFNCDYITDLGVEKFIDGTMYHIDGLIVNGEVVVSYPSKYVGHCYEVTSALKSFGSIMLDYYNPLTKELINYAKKVLLALPTPKNTAFHLEVFSEHSTGELVFCEIASRVGGIFVRDHFIKAFGIDLGKEYLRLSAGLPLEVNLSDIPSKPLCSVGFIGVPSCMGRIAAVPKKPDYAWLLKYNFEGEVGMKLSKAESVNELLVIASFVGASEDELVSRYHLLSTEIERELRIDLE
jgi:hypothetical protein